MNIKRQFGHKKNKGFTLIEMIVVLGAFTIVITISLSSFLAILNAQKKSISIGNVQENLRFAMEMMLKEIRTGTSYYCGIVYDDFGNGANNRDCASGGPVITFRTPSFKVIIYRLKNGVIEKYSSDYSNPQCASTPSDDDCFLKMTFPEIKIQDLKFYVVGSRPLILSDSSPDKLQPRVTITLLGNMGLSQKGTLSSFNIQTTVSQRQIDK